MRWKYSKRPSRAALPVEPRHGEIRGRAAATIARFLGVKDEHEIDLPPRRDGKGIKTSFAYGWAMRGWGQATKIVLTIAETPCQHRALAFPAANGRAVVLKSGGGGRQQRSRPAAMIDANQTEDETVAMSHMSNVLGSGPRREAGDRQRPMSAGRARAVLDGSQAAVHNAAGSRRASAPDFYAVTAQKLYGPSGSGAIHIKAARMAEMRPFIGGGEHDPRGAPRHGHATTTRR